MSDASARAILREAESTGLGTTWARASLELARAGLHDEAGRAAWRALTSGADATEALDALAPDLDAFQVATLGKAGEFPFMNTPAWSQDSGSVFVSAGHRRLVRWDLREERAIDVWSARSRITTIAAAPDSDFALVGSTSDRLATLSRVDLHRGSGQKIERGKYVRAIAFVRDGVLLASLGLEGVWALPCDPKPGASPLWEVGGPDAQLDGSGAFVIGVPRQPGLQRLYDRSGTLVRELEPPFPETSATVVGQRLLFAGRTGHIVLTDLRGNEVARQENAPVGITYAVSPHGKQLAFMGLGSESIRIFDLRTGRFREFALGFHWSVAWSPSGRALAVPLKDGRLTLISAA